MFIMPEWQASIMSSDASLTPLSSVPYRYFRSHLLLANDPIARPRTKRKDTPPPALAREAFLAKGGKEADLMPEACKRVEELPLGERTREEVIKIAVDYGLKPLSIEKAWDTICKKNEVRGGDPKAELSREENRELVNKVLESQYEGNIYDPPMEGIEIRQAAANILAKRNVILPYIEFT